VRGEAVDDVVQDTLMTVHRARASYDPARPFLPWLRAITQRRVIDRLRRSGRRPREVNDPLAYEAEVDPGPAPGHGLEARDRAAALARAVASLPEGQRQAVEHLGLRELSLDETAALTGRSKGALKVNLHRALKALRASLTQERE
jgi:RNA polymerase sigma-70 factor (ECF subfamily)